MPTRAESIRAAAVVLAYACAELETKTPEQVAEDAWYPGHPHGSKEEIAKRWRAYLADARVRQSRSTAA